MNDHRYINENDKLVTGNASRLHYISQIGGWDAFKRDISFAAINAFLDDPRSEETIEVLANANAARRNIEVANIKKAKVNK